ncbi:ParA family protein [Picosynechococcus sp. PCC 7003]|uniref:ParA family protein n=1 Tax=Picosynechococcus sp. PCC 7003 TaxID=374981 RepID=UPI0018DCEAE9|nr:ParA family protein [Picosynechococcus sp. PCC 7003]
MPMTDIQRMTEKTIPALMKQLNYCLNNPYRALVTAVWNQKGGVAKTTNTINIGAELALAGKRVLLIDLDSQNDLTRGLGLIPDKYNSWLLECVKSISQRKIKNAREILNSVIQHRIFPTSEKEKLEIDVLPIGKYALDEFRESKGQYQGFSAAKVFPRIIDLLTPSFDYIFIDTSPAADQLTRSLMYSIDSLLIPIDHGKKSIYHGVRIHKKIKEVRESRKKVKTLHLGPWNLGLVYSNCPADAGKRLDQMIDQELDKHCFSGKRYNEVIRTFAQTKVAEFKQMPVVCWRQSQITKCYQELVKEVFINPNFINE